MLHQNNFSCSTTKLLVVVITLLSVSFIIAQEHKNVILNLDENALVSLNTAIKSDNTGLRKSAIYLAGKHAVEETTETLLSQLKREKDPSLRILIARVLYIIGNEKYMKDVYELAIKDENAKVRKMSSAIYSMMQVQKSINVAGLNN